MPTNIDSLSVQIKASSRSATNQVEKLTRAMTKLKIAMGGNTNENLKKFADQLDRIGKSSTKLNTVASSMTKVATNAGKMNDKLSKTAKTSDKVVGSFTELYSKLRLISTGMRTVSRTIASWINESNEYVENLNLFTVAMGQYSQSAYDYAQKVSDVMGIDPSDWMRNQGVFMTLAKGFGVAGDRAAIMSQQLTQLGYDISSLYNIKVEDSMQKLQSALAGELEPVRRLGYDLSQAKLQSIAASLGIKKLYREMTQAEKSQLRYYALMTQVTQAQGDMARTLNAPANQLRVLRAQVTQAGRALGNIFIPMLNAVLPFAIALAKGIRLLANEIANFFGFKLPEVDYSGLVTTTQDVGDILGDIADDVSDDYDTVSDSVSSATQKIKEFKRYVLAFDELNKIPEQDEPDSTSSGSGSSGGKPSTGSGITAGSAGSDWNFPLPTYDFLAGAVESRADAILEQIKKSMREIELFLSGALLGVGAVLAFTGINVPLGVTMMAAGIVGMAANLDWGALLKGNITKVLDEIWLVVEGMKFAAGAVLLFSGANVPLGIALLASGFLGAGKSLNWGGGLVEPIKNVLNNLDLILNAAFIGAGAVLAFSNINVPLGITLMAAGFVGTAKSLNWGGGLVGPIQNVLSNIATIVGAVELGVGAVLAFSSVNVPLGIVLMADGFKNVASGTSLIWGSLVSGPVKNVLDGIFAIVSVAELVVGAILLFSGTKPLLGLALLASGAIGLAAEATAHWDYIKTTFESIFADAETVALASGGLLIIGLMMAISGVATPLGLALIVTGIAGLGYSAARSGVVKSISDEINEFFGGFGTEALTGAALTAIGLALTVTGVATPLGLSVLVFGLAKLGYAAAHSGVVETISDQINDFFNGYATTAITGAALTGIGLMLLVSGVATPLGLGILVLGLGKLGYAAAKSDLGQNIIGKISSALQDATKTVVAWWNNVVLWWERLDNKVFEIAVAIGTTVEQIWNDLVTAWEETTVGKYLTIKVRTIWDDTQDWLKGLAKKTVGASDSDPRLDNFNPFDWLFGGSAKAEGGDFQAPTIDIGFQVTGAMENIQQAVTDGWTVIKENTAQSMLDLQTLILNGLGNIETHLPLRFATYDGLVTVGWGTIQSHTLTAWVDIFALITNYLVNIETGIGLKMTTYQEQVKAGWTTVTEDTTTSWSTIFTQVTNGLVNIETGIGLKVTSYVNKVKAGWNTIVTVTNTKWHDAQTQVMTALTNLEKGVTTKMNSMVKIAQNVKWDGIGQNIINGIADGINWGWNWLNDMVWNLAMSLYNTACYALGIASPSKLFEHGVGEMVGEGIAKGLDNSEDGVLASVSRIAEDMSQEFANTNARANFSATMGTEIAATAANVATSESASRIAGEQDSYMLAEYVRSGIHDAVYQQNEILKEQNRLLQAIVDKPFTASVGTNEIVNALKQKNRRDGTTVVPVFG